MIGQLVSTWTNVLTHPSAQTFDAQKPFASRDRTMTNVAIAAIVSALLSFILTVLVVSVFAGIARNLGGVPVPVDVGPTAAIKALVNSLVQTFVGFYIFCYALQFVAERLFAGRGNVDEQAYLISVFWAPISILIAFLTFIPCLGWLVAIGLLIYALVLTTFAVQSGQGIATGPAIGSWLLAGIATAIILGILGLITGGWL